MRRIVTPLAALAAAALFGCGPRGDGAPVGELTTSVGDFELHPSGFADIELELRPSRALEEGAEPAFFVHLVDERRRVVRTFDRPLGGAWSPGESIPLRVRLYLSALVEPPPAGELSLTVGLYDPLLGRFPLRTDRRRVGKKEYELARVRIGERSRSEARLEFLDGWGEPQPQQDTQVISQRPLRPGQVGRLRFGPLGGPTELWLQFALPVAGLGDEPVLREGDRAWLRASSACAPAPVEVAGAGAHPFSLRLTPDATGFCEIEVDSNYTLRRAKAARLVTPALQVAAWSAP